MELYKLLSLSFGIKADFSKIYDELSKLPGNTEKDKWVKDTFGMSERHVLFIKKEERSELVYVYFNPPHMNINFSLQRIALTFNKQMITPEETSPELLKKQVRDFSKRMALLMEKLSIRFLSHPFLHVEFVYYNDETDYSKLLKGIVYGSSKWDKAAIRKCTIGFTTGRETSPGKSEHVETIVEHWLKNEKFLFVSGTAQWDIMEHSDNNLEFFDKWISEITENFQRILRRLKEGNKC